MKTHFTKLLLLIVNKHTYVMINVERKVHHNMMSMSSIDPNMGIANRQVEFDF
jgi:hypothetical protein